MNTVHLPRVSTCFTAATFIFSGPYISGCRSESVAEVSELLERHEKGYSYSNVDVIFDTLSDCYAGTGRDREWHP
jgi:hypothetical protein